LLWILQREPPFWNDSNLVKTTPPGPITLFTPTTLMQKFRWKYYELKKKYRPNPLSYTFNASGGPSPCSIHGLLNQAMDAGGTQYLVERHVAGGSVNFGHPVALNGAQWIEAFESALQTNKPEWWQPERKGFRRENLVLLHYGRRTTLVLSEETAKLYEQKHRGLKRR